MKTIQTRKRYTDEIIAYLSLKGEDLGEKKNNRYKTVTVLIHKASEHPPAHVHVDIGKGLRNPSFKIKTGELFETHGCPPSIQKAVKVWLSNPANRAKAIQEWNKCHPQHYCRDQRVVSARKPASKSNNLTAEQRLRVRRIIRKILLWAQQ